MFYPEHLYNIKGLHFAFNFTSYKTFHFTVKQAIDKVVVSPTVPLEDFPPTHLTWHTKKQTHLPDAFQAVAPCALPR
jgi:hypothetical protein